MEDNTGLPKQWNSLCMPDIESVFTKPINSGFGLNLNLNTVSLAKAMYNIN